MRFYKTADFSLFNIAGCVRAVKAYDSKERFPYSGIWLFTGAQGTGKTLLMMHVLHDILKEYPSAKVCSNMDIKDIEYIPYTGIECFDLTNGTDGIIYVLDEIHIPFNSLESQGMPLATMQVWAQNRKNRRLILGTSQRFNRIAKGIREQAMFNYECKFSFFKLIYPYTVIDASEYDEHGNLPADARSSFHFYIPNEKIMNSYDTLQVIKRKEEKKKESKRKWPLF